MTSSSSTPQTRSKDSAGLIDPVEALRIFERAQDTLIRSQVSRRTSRALRKKKQ